MKNLLITAAFLLFLTGSVFAQEPEPQPTTNWGKEAVSKLPEWNQGMAYSAVDNNFNYLTTFEAKKWGDASLSIGYAGKAKNTGNKFVIAASYTLIKFGDYIKMPILDLIEITPGIWAGVGNLGNTDFDSSETDWGFHVIGMSWDI